MQSLPAKIRVQDCSGATVLRLKHIPESSLSLPDWILSVLNVVSQAVIHVEEILPGMLEAKTALEDQARPITHAPAQFFFRGKFPFLDNMLSIALIEFPRSESRTRFDELRSLMDEQGQVSLVS